MARHINDAGLTLIEGFEALRLLAYLAPEGHWTIGWGHTGPDVKEGMKITWAEAVAFKKVDLEASERKVEASVKVCSELNENEFSALVCLAYNLRNFADSGIVKMLNAGKRDWAVGEWTSYNKAHVKGKLVVLAGLTRRRRAELTLFLTPISAQKT